MFDALTGAMLDLPKEQPKSINERHDAWERFSYFHCPVRCPETGPPKMPQNVISKHFLTFVDATQVGVVPGGAEQFERHTAWERDFFKKHTFTAVVGIKPR